MQEINKSQLPDKNDMQDKLLAEFNLTEAPSDRQTQN